MVEISIVKYLLSDTESLSSYEQAVPVTFEDIKRRLFLLQRQANNMLPDQFYRLAIERDLRQIHSLDKLLVDGLAEIAYNYLDITGNKINIQPYKQNEWQETITYLPPLLIEMAFLHKKIPVSGPDIPALRNYFNTYILPNTKYSSLPSAIVNEIDNLLMMSEGFNDLHIHLNGSTEIDIVWQDFLSFPDKIYDEFLKTNHLPFVKEQLEQESTLLNPLKFCELLKIARRIRLILFDLIFPKTSLKPFPPFEKLLTQIVTNDEYSREAPDFFHPFLALLDSTIDLPNNMAVEGLMYILIFENLSKKADSTIASFFHFYMLIQGLSNRLLVQQVHQKGFQQFQKITLNGLRELSEKEYHGRFFQMHGNDLKFLNFLEGRFSPKKFELDNSVILDAISKGWDNFEKKIKETIPPHVNIPCLKLVAHFIKSPDINPDRFIRYKELRTTTWKKGKVLSLLIKNSSKYKSLITGIDAAASEFDTPPEAFAPTFRYLRRSFIEMGKTPHFTYHVGEDFFHLTGGMRAIYEAVDFLELKENDRIGHATAIGISVKHWRKVVGESLLIRKGEWLDNLIFMHFFTKINSFYLSISSQLESSIEKLADEIYGDATYSSITELSDAWMARKYCPTLLPYDQHGKAEMEETYNLDEFEEIRTYSISNNVKNLVSLYNRKDITEKYNEVISINTYEIFDFDYLEQTQKSLLEWLCKKKIIIETLPTSNVRIGNYRSYQDYHLYNWIDWENNGNQIPKIVVGTDDTGIFATNIYNEYANLWQYLVKSKNQSPLNASKIISELNTNSKSFRFFN